MAIKFFRSMVDFDAEAALFNSRIAQAANIFPRAMLMRRFGTVCACTCNASVTLFHMPPNFCELHVMMQP